MACRRRKLRNAIRVSFYLSEEDLEMLDELALKLKANRSEILRRAIRSFFEAAEHKKTTLAEIEQLKRDIAELRKMLDEKEQQISHLEHRLNKESNKQSDELFGKTRYYKCEDGILRTREQIAEYILSLELKKVEKILNQRVVTKPIVIHEFLKTFLVGVTEDELNNLSAYVSQFIENALKEKKIKRGP